MSAGGGVPNITNIGKNKPAGVTGDEREPSSLRGHAQYAGAVIKETLGQALGNEGMVRRSTEDKQSGISEMRAAKAKSDPPKMNEEYPSRDPSALDREGRVQGTFGKAVGCGGMEERSEEKQHAAEDRL